MGIRAGSFSTPASTGSMTVPVQWGFNPTWVFLLATSCTADGTWQTGNSCLSRGIAARNTAGALDTFVHKLTFGASSACSSIGVDSTVEISSTLTALGTTPLVAAAVTGFTTSDFTLNFTTSSTGYKVFWIAGNDPAVYKDVTALGLQGLTWGHVATGAILVGMSDTSGFPTPGVPQTWSPGGGSLWTGVFGMGKTGTGTQDFISYGPCYNTGQQIIGLLRSSIWSYSSDVYAFGQVNLGTYTGLVSGTDINVTGSGTGGTCGLLVFDGTSAAADEFSVASTVSGQTIRTPGIDPDAVIFMGGHGANYIDNPAYTGVSFGVVTDAGDRWVVAAGNNWSSGAAQYQSTSESWISGWAPHNAPSATKGTAVLSGGSVTTTTTNVGDPYYTLRYAAFGPGIPDSTIKVSMYQRFHE